MCSECWELPAPDRESDAWQPGARRSEHATEESPELHQLVHQRLRTTTDILGPNPKIKARPRTYTHVVVGVASDYGTEGILAQ